MTPSNHDSFLRTVFSTPVHAASLLATFLGEDFRREFDLTSLTLLPGTFIDPELLRHQVDFLFKVKAADKSVYIYVLLEHQSTPFAMMRLSSWSTKSLIYRPSLSRNFAESILESTRCHIIESTNGTNEELINCIVP